MKDSHILPVLIERPNKRRNITKWRKSRLARFEQRILSPRQHLRKLQLEKLLGL